MWYRYTVHRTLILGLVAILAGLAAAPGQPSRAAAVDWDECGDGFECAFLPLPLDYSGVTPGEIQLSIIRLPAGDRSKRIGSLVVNPGGPGASGVDFVRQWAPGLPGRILDRFDIVGFDPRGIGRSSPITCHSTLIPLTAADPSPDDEAEFDALARLTRAFADECAATYGDVLPYLGTRNVARDLDRLRVALGDEKLTYLGFSYGTEIGQVYAGLFPGAIRAMVLDGAVDLSIPADDRALAQAASFERALQAFAQDCRDTLCSLTRRGDPLRAIDDLFARVEAAPIPARRANRPAGPGEALLGIVTPLYSRESWPALARAIDTALAGDGTQLVQLTDQYLERLPDGSYTNSTEANLAVNCVDSGPSKLPVRWADYPAAAARFAAVSPRFGPAVAVGLSCANWAAPPDPTSPPAATGAPPILVVSTTGDPATPYEWGVAVARQLPGAALLTFDGEGHTAYSSGDRCVDNAVDAYLVQLKVPAPGAACPSGAADDTGEMDDIFGSRDSGGGMGAVLRSLAVLTALAVAIAGLAAFARASHR